MNSKDLKDLFEYKDYKQYLRDQIAAAPKGGHGMRSKLADSMHSPVSHISQVLKGSSQLTFEQAEAANDFLGHNEEQAEFFLLLVQRARAGTPGLQKRIDKQIERAVEKRLTLKNRFKLAEGISRENQVNYYSSWIYAAAHILLTIPGFETKEAIARKLGLSLKRAGEILDFLISCGLAEQEGGNFKTGKARIYLGGDSPLISKHHSNWRLRAVQSLEKEDRDEDLHYSSVVSISKEDFMRVRFALTRELEATKAIIRDTEPTELCGLCMDFFKL